MPLSLPAAIHCRHFSSHLVDVLPARTPGARRLDLDVLGPDVDRHVIDLRHHRHRRRAGVHATLGLGRRHTLQKKQREGGRGWL